MSKSRPAFAGFLKQPRGFFDDDVFDGVFDRRSAFMWLVGEAVRCRTVDNIAGTEVVLERGQLCHSLRYMAKAWRWEETKVRRFLRALKKAGKATASPAASTAASPAARQMIVTICNFDHFQGSDGAPAASTAASPAASTAANNKSQEEVEESDGASHHTRAGAAFGRFYGEYPHKVGKGAARRAFAGALRKASETEIMEGLRRYIASKPVDQKWCNPATWLNQERWTDQPALQPTSNAAGQRQRPSDFETHQIAMAILEGRAPSPLSPEQPPVVDGASHPTVDLDESEWREAA